MDTTLALKQSTTILLLLPTAIGFVSYLFDDLFVSGVLWGLVMAIIIILLYWWSDILGNPEYAGWLSKNND
jgi:hypothetical protein